MQNLYRNTIYIKNIICDTIFNFLQIKKFPEDLINYHF